MKHRTDLAPTGRLPRSRGTTKPPSTMAEPARRRFENQSPNPPRGLKDKIAQVAIADLKPFPGNPRQHPEVQIARLMRSIAEVWTNPILIDETGTILAGHGRLEAAKRLGRT